MRILLTGGSSFTGYWFARELSAAGHDVVAALKRAPSEYDPASVRAERVRRLGAIARIEPSAPLGSEAFLACCRESFDVFCHHAAQVEGYREEGFDVAGALDANTKNLAKALGVLRAGGLKSVVLTGTVFEQDEGAGDEPLRAVSSYGLSKGLTFQVFRYWCEVLGLPLAKFVIPNPFGVLEEPRFCRQLMAAWLRGERALVKTPRYVRDNIHVDLLASVYARFVEASATSVGPGQFNPSGYVETQADFAFRLAREMGRRLSIACEFESFDQQDFPEPRVRVNTEPAAGLAPAWSEAAAWDAYAEQYRQGRGSLT